MKTPIMTCLILILTLLLITGCKSTKDFFSIDGPSYPPPLHDDGVRPKKGPETSASEAIRTSLENASNMLLTNILHIQTTNELNSSTRRTDFSNKFSSLKNKTQKDVLDIVKNTRDTNKLNLAVSEYFSQKYMPSLAQELAAANVSVDSSTNSISIAVTNAIGELAAQVASILATNRPSGISKETNVITNFQIAADDDATEEFGKTFAQCFYVGEIVIENRNASNTFLAYSSTLITQINYFLAEKDWTDNTNKSAQSVDNLNEANYPTASNAYCYVYDCPRRPSTYSDILAIFEYQRDRVHFSGPVHELVLGHG